MSEETWRLRQVAQAAVAERDRLREAVVDAHDTFALVYVMLTGLDDAWRDMPWDERCARAANEAQCAFLRLEGEESLPPKPASEDPVLALIAECEKRGELTTLFAGRAEPSVVLGVEVYRAPSLSEACVAALVELREEKP